MQSLDEVRRDQAGGRFRARPAVPPAALLAELPLTEPATATVRAGRLTARRVLSGADDRLLVVVGPCSVHDANAALAYAKTLGRLAEDLVEDLAVVLRVYIEKPRTTVGWTGLLTDPALDGSADVDRGLRECRALMLEITEMGLPVATEWLSPTAPAYLSDLVSWGAIGARTVESQVHRQLASGLPMPVGMKNGSGGSVEVAIDAIRSAAAPHAYLGSGPDGSPAVLRTSGNPDCHVVLRGAADKPNYGAAHVREALRLLAAAGLPTGLVIDASHGNSGKDHERQAEVAHEIGARIAAGDTHVRGIMLEGFLVPGRQDIGVGEPVFGQSVTDACMGWDATERVLRSLAESTRRRRVGQAGDADFPAPHRRIRMYANY